LPTVRRKPPLYDFDVDNNKQLSDANVKLKADLKKATDELIELRAQAEKNRSEALRMSETHTLLMGLRAREDEYKN
jgi:hypothetical protein